MEGLLWKWTNYWSGWQLRWFILDEGVLSYYKSQDEVSSGCKGSVKMSVCDVLVNQNDPTRLDLVIHGEQHFYIRASNQKERQQWLVALGSCKASQQALGNILEQPDAGQLQIEQPKVKQKRSELRIYCDLLMQQVHSIRQAASDDPPNTEAIEQSSLLLSETCDTFIHTLESCMTMLDRPTMSRQSSMRDSTTSQPSSPVSPGFKHLSRSPSPSVDKLPPGILKKSSRSASLSSTDTDAELNSPVHRSHNGITTGGPDQNSNSKAPEDRIITFFDTLPCSFTRMSHDLEDGVKTKLFLDCSRSLAAVFDKMSSTAFAPVKSDFLGNVKKIEQKWKQNPNGFMTLENIVNNEIGRSDHLDPNSATQALLWLTRGLLFVSGILEQLDKQPELVNAVSSSYERTLKPFHNFVVRGVVSIAMRALPYKDNFARSLADNPDDADSPALLPSLYAVLHTYTEAILRVCEKIQLFYKQKNMIIIN